MGRERSEAKLTENRPARLRVGLIGAGRVGATLGVALRRSGHTVVAVSAVSERSRRRVEELLPGVPIRPLDQVPDSADLVLLAVPDDMLRDLVAGLAGAGAWRPGQLVAHTSGAHGVGVLDSAAARGALPLALHPAMTFAGRSEDLDRLLGAPWGVTAPGELRPVAETLVMEMGGEPIWVPEAARPLYHAALVMGSNYLITLVGDALSMLADAGIERPAQLVAPLLSAALDNVLRLGDAALTGPVSRGDAATVAVHLRTLADTQPELREPYLAMARRTAQRAHAAGRLDEAGLRAILAVLQ